MGTSIKVSYILTVLVVTEVKDFYPSCQNWP